jgi:hypothetical protein
MRCRTAAGGLLLAGLTAAAGVPPIPPVVTPDLVRLLPEPEPQLTDPAKLAERIEKNAKAATDKLAGKDPGAVTRNAQQQTLRDIDELLKQAENPPPMGGDGSAQPPMGGESGPPPMGGSGQPPPSGGSSGKKPQGGPPKDGSKGQGQPKPGGGQQSGPTAIKPGPGGDPPTPAGTDDKPMGENQPGGGQLSDKPGDGSPGGAPGKGKPALPLDDPIAKQVWGHLPDTVRRQMSQYYREQFMPRYSGLLKDYFAALAEREKAGKR